MTEQFRVSAVRAPDMDDAEALRRLSRAYTIIIDTDRRTKAQKTADRGEFGDQTRTAEEATAPDKAVPS